ncbi:MAG: glycosyltransferase family 2 protein [Muribaculum sp.]|nr:glycosyltransferase family 2 protein [Muribaculum sp.]
MDERNIRPRLAIVVPCYNEEEVLPLTAPRLESLVETMIHKGLAAPGSSVVYVDDGSADHTWQLITARACGSDYADGVRLAANAGHQNALLAGMEQTADRFDAIVSIDADLQDDINAIPRMVALYQEGYDIVYGVRESRATDTWFKRVTAQGFYRTMSNLGVKSIYNHADFRLMSSRAVRSLLSFPESNMFLRGIVPLLGLRQTTVGYDRTARQAGESKYPLKKMVNFAVNGITSFSVRPVRMVFWIGVIFLTVSLGILIYVLIRYFMGHTIAGWTSLMISVWFCSSILLMSLGVIGEYIGKIYVEVKHRPRYFIESTTFRK